MKLMHEGKNVLFLDFETTGLFGKKGVGVEVVELAMKLYEKIGTKEEKVTEYSQLYSIEGTMTEYVAVLTGITDEMLVGKPTYKSHFDIINKFVQKSDILVAHHVPFEVKCLELININIKRKRFFDTKTFSEVLMPGRPRYGMATMIEYFGIENFAAHRAMGDVNAMIELYYRITDVNIHPKVWKHDNKKGLKEESGFTFVYSS